MKTTESVLQTSAHAEIFPVSLRFFSFNEVPDWDSENSAGKGQSGNFIQEGEEKYSEVITETLSPHFTDSNQELVKNLGWYFSET